MKAPQLESLLERAVSARRRLVPPRTTIYRLVHDEGDGLPGLVVDVYGPVAIVQAYRESWRPHLQAVSSFLRHAGWRSVRAVVRGTSGAGVGEELREGEPLPEELTAEERGLAFRIRPSDQSLSVGLFTQARDARARVQSLSGHAKVLNLFAYAGGFTVAALAGGALEVDQVDAAARTAPWSARNVAINGSSPSACRFVVDDALAFTARAVRQGRRYDLCILDIPTFGRSEKGRHSLKSPGGAATRGLIDAVRVALSALEDGGRLLVGANARTLTAEDLWAAVQQAGQGATLALEELLGPGVDYPGEASVLGRRELKALLVRQAR